MIDTVAHDSIEPRRTSSMAPSPCPDCGAALVRAHRRWHERWRTRVVKRCTACGVRIAYPHVAGSRAGDPRRTRVLALALLFLVLALIGPALVISLLPVPEGVQGGIVTD